MKKNKYPFCEALGLTVYDGSLDSKELQDVLDKLKITQVFDKYFGCQTISGRGPYASDCEAVFVRIYKGLLTGTQNPHLWD